MKEKLLKMADEYKNSHKRKRLWYKVVTSLAAVVVFCTVYALILPAITMEGNSHTSSNYTASNSSSVHTSSDVHSASEVHTASNVQTASNALPQGDLLIMLPYGAQIPEGYDVEFSYIDPDNRFGVVVYAPEGALPEDAVLVAELLEEGSDEYAEAEDALNELYKQEDDDFEYDGMIALDIRFEVDGEEIEPEEPVYVCLNIVGLLPEDADPDSVEIQHHAEKKESKLFGLIEKSEKIVEKVADAEGENGIVEIVEEEDEEETVRKNISAAFALDGFSNVTATYNLRTAALSDTSFESRFFEVDAVNVLDTNANVILVYPESTVFNYTTSHSLGGLFGTDTDFDPWYVVRIENRQDRYQAIQAKEATKYEATEIADGYLLLVKKELIKTETNSAAVLCLPKADWPEPYHTDVTSDGEGDTAQFNLLKTDMKTTVGGSEHGPYAYVTFSPKGWNGFNGSMDAKKDDAKAVAESAIRFKLFDYDGNINYEGGNPQAGDRKIMKYFNFRSNHTGYNGSIDKDYDQDGFTANHATVERTLKNGYPVLDLTRKADGGTKPVLENPPTEAQRSLAYLFGGTNDLAVKKYTPNNTILQKAGTKYYYNSAQNAVDYDTKNDMFRVRNYQERNKDTASSYENSSDYYDFLPFNYTDGVIVGTGGKDINTFNLMDTQVNYWFGMRMDVDFYQYKDGIYDNEKMVFNFSGDDDVWVFIDDVLVLDLGGTHGMVSGSINFATGEIEQYINWDGVDGRKEKGDNPRSYPTTLKKCFEAAGRTPSGGWNSAGTSFADYSSHTMSFFYMERGSGVANCSLDFNLPILPKEALQVTKELAADDEANSEVVQHLSDTMTYQFRVVKADANGNPTKELLVKEGDPYELYGTGVTDATSQGTVGVGGYFTLKPGQTAVFTDMMGRFTDQETNKTYIVQELLPNGVTGQYKEVVYTVGTKEGTITSGNLSEEGFTGFSTPVLSADTSNLVAYKNKVDTEKLSELQITKEVKGSAITGMPDTYYMKVWLGPDANNLTPLAVGTPYWVGTEKRTVQEGEAGIVRLASSETAKIKLLLGTWYSVEEVAKVQNTDGTYTFKSLTGQEGYEATYTGDINRDLIGQFTVETFGEKKQVTVTNTYPTGDLILSKTVEHTGGGSVSGEFTFELRFEVPETWKGTSYDISCTNSVAGDQIHEYDQNSLKFEPENPTEGKHYAKATLKLYHGEVAKIKDIPKGTQITVKETNYDGYSVKWNVDGEESFTNQVTVTIPDKTSSEENSSVTANCTNTTGYELPATGGPGTRWLLVLGGLMMATATMLLGFVQRRKYERRPN